MKARSCVPARRYRAIDQFGQVVDVFGLASQRCSCRQAVLCDRDHNDREEDSRGGDRSSPYLPGRARRGLARGVRPQTSSGYANNAWRPLHGRLKARLRPMRGLKRDCSARDVVAGHAWSRMCDEAIASLDVDATPNRRLVASFAELAVAIRAIGSCSARVRPPTRANPTLALDGTAAGHPPRWRVRPG